MKGILPYAYSIPTCGKFNLRWTSRKVTTAQVEKCLDKYYIEINNYTLYCRLNGLRIILLITQISTSKHHSYPCACQEGIPWSGGIDPLIFKLGIRWRLVVIDRFTHAEICLDTHRIRGLVIPSSSLGRFGEQKNCFSIAGNRTTIPRLSCRSLVSD